LADVIEDIWDWDVPESAIAHRLTLRLLPSSYAFLLFQYRVPLTADWTSGHGRTLHLLRRHIAVQMQSGLVTIRPIGPIGSVLVRVRLEVADRLLSMPLSKCLNRKINLCQIFQKLVLGRLGEALAAAPNARARVTLIENFLLHQQDPARTVTALTRAADRLRFNPSTSVRDLAAQLNMSVRHLSRGFKAAFGTGPKQFARLARVEKAFAARRDGHRWSDIAHACGFADQAHLIHDFRAILGSAPEEIFKPPVFRSWAVEGRTRCRPFFSLFVAG
jgi:AraC-like DNA-binding protein